MLFTCSCEFFDYVDKIKNLKPLNAEEEKELAILIKQGDENARQKLRDNYLPYVASTIKKYSSGEPSLDLIYRFITALDNLIDIHDFSNINNSFTRALSFKLRQTITNHIADS